MGTEALYRGARQSRRETEHSPPCSAKNKDWMALYFHSAVILSWLVQVLYRLLSALSLDHTHFRTIVVFWYIVYNIFITIFNMPYLSFSTLTEVLFYLTKVFLTLRFSSTLAEDFLYPDWSFSLPWLRFFPTLTEVFLYPDWGFSLPWLKFFSTLTEVFLYPDWGFSLPWLRVFSTLTEVSPCFFLSCKPNARV